jgi:predicted phosphate transport protein (TIGR00153 family)
MKLFDLFKPKPNKFLTMLVEQSNITVKGLELLTQYLVKRSSNVARQISEAEKEADEVRRILIEELMKTFVTPLDREDIFSLSRDIDDILDYANTTVYEMETLDVNPTQYMQQMAQLLHDAAKELQLAVLRLQDNHLNVSAEHAHRAKKIENRVEAAYRDAIADLFKGPKNIKHIMTMLKTREIYRHLSNAADREDQAANVISDIIMKAT